MAVQGPNPKAEALRRQLHEHRRRMIPYYHFAQGKVAGVQWLEESRTTGETKGKQEGLEMITGRTQETRTETAVGKTRVVQVRGATRQWGSGGERTKTLRLEARDGRLPMYGNDIDDTTTQYEAAYNVHREKSEKGCRSRGSKRLC